MRSNNNGLSLVGVLIAAGLISGLSLVIMQLMKNSGQVQHFAQSGSDQTELFHEIRMILNDERYCRVSLAGNDPVGSPVTFKKTQVDEPNNGEGLDVELWLSNQAGDARTVKKLSATDPSKNQFGQLTIKNLKLVMNNGTGTNYAESPGHNDMGKLHLIFEKKVGNNQIRQLKEQFAVRVGMKTDASGTTTLLSCSGEPTLGKIEIIPSGSGSDGMTGHEACASIGKSCIKVLSQNFPSDAPGCGGMGAHCVRVCMTDYNQSLPGVEAGGWKDNIHSCDARVGRYSTYLDVGVLRCDAYFSAYCQ